MTERTRGDLGSTENDLHFHISKLLIGTAIAGVATTSALIVAIVADMPPGRPPPPGPDGRPPPPDLQALALFSILTGLFVLAWLAFLVAYSRDQVLRRIRAGRVNAGGEPESGRQELQELMDGLRRDMAEDHRRELAALEERIASLTSDYGEQRETDGYINGMRVATSGQPGADVRSIRRAPPAN